MKGYNGKKVLITGGAGFVGSSLCEELLKYNAKVWSLDNYFTGSTENHVENVNYIKAETRTINEIEFDTKFDFVFHLGEYSRVEQSFDDIDSVFEFNTSSIYQVLKFVNKNDAKLIYSGSSTKFGDGGANGNESPYAWTKKTNADLVSVYCNWFNINFAITYFYNVYGEREISHGKYATLIAKYKTLCENDEAKLPVVQPGTQKRNFTHISDIVSGIMLVGLYGEGDGFGIGSDISYSILDVVSLFDKTPQMLPPRKGNRMSAPVNSDRTKELGWVATYKLEDYIKTSR